MSRYTKNWERNYPEEQGQKASWIELMSQKTISEKSIAKVVTGYARRNNKTYCNKWIEIPLGFCYIRGSNERNSETKKEKAWK